MTFVKHATNTILLEPEVKEPYMGSYFINNYTSGNCQLFSVAHFCNILNGKKKVAEIRTLISDMRQAAGKRLMLLDIQHEHKTKLKRVIKPEEIMMEYPYESTNGSSMILYLINTTNIQ